MTVKQGKVKITTSRSNSSTVRTYNIVEKTEGAYAETLTELESHVTTENYTGTDEVIENLSESGEGYRVFPMEAALAHISSIKNTTDDVVEWVEVLTEVVA